jgi:electron transfer flavoprotein alpha subunit
MKNRNFENTAWVIAEHSDGKVNPITYEVIAFAREFGKRFGGETTVVVVGFPAEPIAEEIAVASGCEVIGINSEAASNYSAEVYRSLISRLLESHTPQYIFIPHSATGWDFAPALAVDIGASCITGVSGIKDDGGPLFTRGMCNGKIYADVRALPDRPAIVTMMAGSAKPEGYAGAPGSVSILEMKEEPRRSKTLCYVEAPAGSLGLQDAEVVVTGGRGLGAPEHLDILRELAGLFYKAVVAGSRPVCDLGWLPFGSQVGMTGQTVSPKLYIACGISGALQHTMGMSNSELIISINTDRNALFCRTAHFCVTLDLHKFVPVLIEKIREFKSGK